MPLSSPTDPAFTTVPTERRAKVRGSLINPDTLLATDYLNHFNEAVMLIGMVPDMPEILADVLAWRPKSYPDHFLGSGLDYGALAAEAYEHVPPAFKNPFEMTIAQIGEAIALSARRLEAAVAAADTDLLRRTGVAAAATLTTLIAAAGAIIAGSNSTLAQDEIDRLLAGG